MQEHSIIQQFKDPSSLPLASMETRKMIANDTREAIENAFSSGEPYANIEVFRNLFDIEEIMEAQNKFIFDINVTKFENPIIAGQLVRVYAQKIHYFNFRGKSLTEKIARACEFESNSGNEDKIPAEIQDYFEKILNIFCKLMLDEDVKITSGYVMSLLINLAELQ